MGSERDMSYPRDEPRPLPSYPPGQRRPAPARPPLTKRMRLGHWMAIDVAVGALGALVELFVTIPHGTPVHVGLPTSIVLMAGVFLPVGLRRQGPVAAFGVLIIVAVLTSGAGPAATLVVFLAAAYVLYLVAATSDRRTGVAALALALGVIVLIASLGFDGGVGAFVPVALAAIIAWMIGYSVRQRRLYAQTMQYQVASSAVAEERLRIARELHDVVAHSMSVIAVQAGYGQYVIDTSPDDARDALGAIQATSRDALEEMRRMLGVLRQQDVTGPGVTGPGVAAQGVTAQGVTAQGVTAQGVTAQGVTAQGVTAPGAGPPGTAARVRPAPLAPAPGLADLDRLVQRTCGAGVEVRVQRSGTVRAVPAGVDMSAYRIIQEALTNVVKHAGGGARCVVGLGYGDGALDIRITDDGGRSLVVAPAVISATAAGHGLIGMRERANLCGGQFSAGPLPDGGFRVTATLPLLPLPAGAYSVPAPSVAPAGRGA